MNYLDYLKKKKDEMIIPSRTPRLGIPLTKKAIVCLMRLTAKTVTMIILIISTVSLYLVRKKKKHRHYTIWAMTRMCCQDGMTLQAMQHLRLIMRIKTQLLIL